MASITVPRPGQRLITQNLIGSAASALELPNPGWAAIQDLTTIIDAFCMYDEATVLGRELYQCLSTSIGVTLTSSNFLTVEQLTGENAENVTKAAKQHLLALANTASGIDPVMLDDLLKRGLTLNANHAVHQLNFMSHGDKQLHWENVWVKTASAKAAESEPRQKELAEMYLIRSFLYAAYSDLSGLILIPDYARSSLLEKMISGERLLREKLLEKIATSSYPVEPVVGVDLKRISPLAAVVFERAKPDKLRIPTEMDLLRTELSDLRKRLRTAEKQIFFGKGTEVADGRQKWDQVIEELGRDFGDEPHLVSLDGILRFGEKLGEAVETYSKPKGLDFSHTWPSG